MSITVNIDRSDLSPRDFNSVDRHLCALLPWIKRFVGLEPEFEVSIPLGDGWCLQIETTGYADQYPGEACRVMAFGPDDEQWGYMNGDDHCSLSSAFEPNLVLRTLIAALDQYGDGEAEDAA